MDVLLIWICTESKSCNQLKFKEGDVGDDP